MNENILPIYNKLISEKFNIKINVRAYNLFILNQFYEM